MIVNRTVNTMVFDILRTLFTGGQLHRVLTLLEMVISEESCPDNMTSYLIHSRLEHLIEEHKLGAEISKQEYEDTISELLDFMHKSGMGLWYYTFPEKLSEPFQEFVDTYLNTDNIPEEKDFTGELIAAVYYYLTGVASGDYPERVEQYKPLLEKINRVREKDSYNGLMNEYDAQQVEVTDDSILKSINPVDVSHLPEYIIDSLYLYKGKYYRPSDIRKMITASSQTAQSLEREDLEDEQTKVNISAEESGRRYIKKLKMKREKKKDES